MREPRRLVIVAEPGAAGSAAAALPDGARATLLQLGDGAGADAPDAVERVVALPNLSWDIPVDALGPAVAPLVQPDDVLVMESSQPARDLAGWLVGARGAAVVWAVDAICAGDSGVLSFQRVALGGTHRLLHELDGDGPALVLVTPGATAPPRAATSAPLRVEARPEIRPAPSAVRVIERVAEAPGTNDLRSARVVVSVGRGIGGPEHVELFRKLADRLGAAFGASRVAVDAGWVPFAFQVGQTGTTIAPDVYLAFGISGAIQHQAGMRNSAAIVAVNTDPCAPVCELADLVVEGDAVAVAESLLERLLDHA